MRYTLLELTKRILESMESDEVSDINETPESISVANIIKECYFDIVGELNMAEQEGLFKFDASGDNTKPCLMTVPSTVSRVQWVKYNQGEIATPDYKDVRFVANDEYFYYQQGVDTADTTVDQMTVSINSVDYVFSFKNNVPPKYYTIFDEYSVIFDSYDSAEESTLTQVRSLGFGSLVPSFSFENSWVPDLDPRQFQLLLQDAKQTAFTELKQAQNPVAEKKARKNRILTQKNKFDNDPKWSNQLHAGFGRNSCGYDAMKRTMRNGQ